MSSQEFIFVSYKNDYIENVYYWCRFQSLTPLEDMVNHTSVSRYIDMIMLYPW